jgi:quercetin dioxygenase-like cupin family protein
LINNPEVKSVEMMPGVRRKNLTDGDKMMLCEILLEQGSVVPSHTHPHEQTGYLVSGRVRFQIGDEVRELAPGDAWMIPGGVPHEVTTLETAVALDIFSPPREDFR